MNIQDLEKYPFKQRLIILRNAQGIPQKELSDKINANASSIGAWERGECLPKGNKLKTLAEALGVPHEILVRWRVEETINFREKR